MIPYEYLRVIVSVIIAWLMYSIWRYVKLCIWPRKLYSKKKKEDRRQLYARWSGPTNFVTYLGIPISASIGIGVLIAYGLYAVILFMSAEWGWGIEIEEVEASSRSRDWLDNIRGIGLFSGFVIVWNTLHRIEQTYTSLLTARIEKLVLTTKVKFAKWTSLRLSWKQTDLLTG